MIRALWNWHEQPVLIAFVQTPAGRVLLWLVAMALLLRHQNPLVVLLALTLVMAVPKYKRSMLAIASLAMITRGMYMEGEHDWVMLVAKAAVVVLVLFAVYLVLRQIRLWPEFARRRPVMVLHAGLWFAIALSQVPMLGLLAQLPLLLGRLSYLFRYAGRGLIGESRFRDHLMYLMPAWGGHTSPIGKGLDYLDRAEADTPEAMARSQLAGLKLTILSLLWALSHDWLTHDFLDTAQGIPSLTATLDAGATPPWYLGWAIIYVELVRKVLSVCIHGHLFVGALRLFGFNVFRNTYKPLLSESVVDFWGRFYFYFKEILVDFFFYPVYLRLRRWKPRLRLGAAVFAAACIGNMYYHLLAYDALNVLQGNWEYLWSHWGTRLVYCCALAFGIWISMMRQQRRRAQDHGTAHWLVRARRIAGVLTFYAIIRIWNDRSLESDTVDAFRFFFSLFGL